MDKQPIFFCVCSQKGGVGKSTFTILLASWLHYALGRDVLVVDCDAPQWSIVAQRERELDVLERNDRYKLMMVRLFKRTGRKIWPVVRSTPDEGLQAARAYLAAGDREADFVLLDIAQGRVWSGSDALGIGLIDTYGGLTTAIAIAADKAELGDDYRIAEIFDEPTNLPLLFRMFGAKIRTSFSLSELGEAMQTYGRIQEAVSQQGVVMYCPYRLDLQ